ncbi:hypothetical protein D2N39_13135 [Gemmobacter lutimaris]|uniref:Uncharacterized protein n=1 Tax=Gemmobacter lutimaris TaxID=2306023 RepID=A0A398BKF8_9RHOB|nr:hypothetical protein [Gemmobacter lutimaris]RID91199.1 hypothetical protein D2N39_13135 [Gemmobacter lutimaris]
MSNLATHLAEQAALTAAYEAECDAAARGAMEASRDFAQLQDARDHATILAALRFWQREAVGLMDNLPEDDIASDEGTLTPLTREEIDALCDRLNENPDPLHQPVLSWNCLPEAEAPRDVVTGYPLIGLDLRFTASVAIDENDRDTIVTAPHDATATSLYAMAENGEAIALHDSDLTHDGAAEIAERVRLMLCAIIDARAEAPNEG